MKQIGVYLMLLAIWVQSATLLSQRGFVADPVELAHLVVIEGVFDAEVDKPTGRFNFDFAADLSNSSLATIDFARLSSLFQSSFCLAHRADAQFQRGPPTFS